MGDFFMIELNVDALRKLKKHSFRKKDGTVVETFKLVMRENKNQAYSTHTIYERKEKGIAKDAPPLIVGSGFKYENNDSPFPRGDAPRGNAPSRPSRAREEDDDDIPF